MHFKFQLLSILFSIVLSGSCYRVNQDATEQANSKIHAQEPVENTFQDDISDISEEEFDDKRLYNEWYYDEKGKKWINLEKIAERN